MKKARSSPVVGLLLASLTAVVLCGGVQPALGAEPTGAGAADQPGPGADKVVKTLVIPAPAARNMRYSLAEKRAAIEGRKKMKADIAARKAAQQPAAEPAQ